MNRRLKRLRIFILVSAVLMAVSTQPVFGNIVGPIYLSDGVTIYSPVNTTYNTKNILFNYTVAVGIGSHLSLNYTLDGTLTAPMPFSVINPQELHVVSLARGQVQLPEISEGLHTLTISMHTDFIFSNLHSYVDTIYFTVDPSAPDFILDATPPKITVQAPQTNQTYFGDVPLNVLLSKPTAPFTVTFDSNRTVTLPAQNTSLTDLTVGEHSISIQANVFAGNPGYSNYVKFNVAEPTPTPASTPTPIEPTKPPQAPLDAGIIAVLAVGCCTAVFMLVYFGLRRREVAS